MTKAKNNALISKLTGQQRDVFLLWLLTDETYGVLRFADEMTKSAIETVIVLFKRRLAGDNASMKEWAVASYGACDVAEDADATEDAAYTASNAAYAAYAEDSDVDADNAANAAYAISYTTADESTKDAAHTAAMAYAAYVTAGVVATVSATAYGAAIKVAYLAQSEKLLELLKDSEV